jgi:hypothetical protein
MSREVTRLRRGRRADYSGVHIAEHALVPVYASFSDQLPVPRPQLVPILQGLTIEALHVPFPPPVPAQVYVPLTESQADVIVPT